MHNKEILLIDDEEDVLEFLSYNLRKEGFRVHLAHNGLEGIKKIKELQPTLVILDLMMPEMDGIEVCQTVRSDISILQPIITLLTSRAEDYSQIAGLDAGADDYLTKPIRPRLLVSKVGSLLRRNERENIISRSTNLIIDRERFIVILENEELTLPKKEFELLELLASKPGRVFNREQILSTIWGDSAIVGERTIDVHVRKLREKLGNDYIRTIKGVGYTYHEK
ncbi:MAG: response regulator transcription factor [Crocinitomicaceae bacterium]|nr:response regulator transcription factor [Crocinitomicaceae bacterium]MDG1658237.1 response regulator transcription factor [Crocinitomicaceae bacterium]MDG2441203.1 response regulator transcription factor [Crocinitomicaceae bacterium]